jgi:hypothetical protein
MHPSSSLVSGSADNLSVGSKEKPAAAPPLTAGFRQRMKTTKDWFALATEILPQAKAGNPEAQYVMFVTYRECRSRFGAHYDTPDAARQFAIQYDLSVERAESGFLQCHGFFTVNATSLGDPWDWLQQATDAGYAPAQAQTARERLSQDRLKAAARTGATPNDPTVSLPPIGGDVSPRDLLAAAVQSADPDVLAEIGNLQYLLNPQLPLDVIQINSAAWMYVACQRGADCSVYGPATLTNCGPNDGHCIPVPDQFLTNVNYNWAPVQERVNQINAALDAKKWEELGLIAGE